MTSTRTRVHEVEIDVTGAQGLSGLPGPLVVAASVFVPERPATGWRGVVVVLPGGGYTRSYYDLDVPGLPGYSMAQHLCAAGLVVVALDHLGTGASTLPPAGQLTLEAIAAANHAAVKDLVEQLSAGGLAASAEARSAPGVVGVGHSMGGSLLVLQQSAHRTFDAIITLGAPMTDVLLPMDPSGAPLTEIPHAPLPPGVPDGYGYSPTRAPFRYAFYLDDVPDAVLRADEREVTTVPPCAQQLLEPGILVPHAAAVTVPVLTAFGERDVSPDPHADVAAFSGSCDVTLYVLEGSAHCHNLARTRALLWDRMDRWIGTVAMAGRRS